MKRPSIRRAPRNPQRVGRSAAVCCTPSVPTIVLSNRVLTAAGVFAPAALVIEGGVITDILPQDVARSAWPQAPVDDLGDHWLTPAMVDGHTHVALHALRGVLSGDSTRGNVVEDLFYRFESGLDAAEVRAFARMGAWEALLHGTGCVFDHYFHAPAVAEALVEVGLTGVVAPTLQDLGGPFAHASDEGLADVERLDSPSWAERGIVAALGPHAMDTVSRELWRQIADVAQRRELPVHVHVAQSLEEVQRVSGRHGHSPVQELLATGVLDAAPRALLVHMIYADGADLAALRGGRALLGHCPHSAFVLGHPARVDRWRDLPWLVGSDCAASNDAMDVRGELRVVHGLAAWASAGSAAYTRFAGGDSLGGGEAWRERGRIRAAAPELLEPASLLGRVTTTPGTFHPRQLTGTLAPGALANLAVWDAEHPVFWPALDPLRAIVLGNASAALLHVMTRGEWRGERGRFAQSLRRSELYRAHREEASQRLHQRLQRLGLQLAPLGQG